MTASELLFAAYNHLPPEEVTRLEFCLTGLTMALRGFPGAPRREHQANRIIHYAEAAKPMAIARAEYLASSSPTRHRLIYPYTFWVDIESAEFICWGINLKKWLPLSLLQSEGLVSVVRAAEQKTFGPQAVSLI